MATKNLFFLFSILMSMVGTKALAYDIAVDNADGVTIYYNYVNDGKELEVTYKEMKVTIINSDNTFEDYINDYNGSVVIPEEVTYMNRTRKVTRIGTHAFDNCSGLTSVTIPNSVTSIGYCAFDYCIGLTSVLISDIASWCKISFSDSNPLCYAHHLYLNGEEILDLVIPKSVTSIGVGAFWGCSSLTSVEIPNSVTSIGAGAFRGCSGLTSVEIPNSVTSIGVGAFRGCSGLTSVTIPNSITAISDEIFEYCSSLTSVEIPNSVTSIGVYAFRGCSGLTSVTIGNSVRSIGQYAFADCDLTEVISKIDNPFEISTITFSDNTFYNATLYVPAGTSDKYKATSGWKKFLFIEDSPTEDEINITSAGQTTWCNAYDLDFTGVEGLKAYSATGYERSSGIIWLTRIYKVPANEGILLIGNAGTYKVPRKKTKAYYANLMVGTLKAITINETNGEYTNYYLSNGTQGIGFYKVNGRVDLKANRAYLPLLKGTTQAGTRFIGLGFEDGVDGTTGISNNNREPITNNHYYNLQGQRIENPGKGLYIRNGKKVIIR